MLLRFAGMKAPVLFADCPELPDLWREIVAGWEVEEVGDSGIAPIMILRREGDDYGIAAAWREEIWYEPSPIGAICSFVVDLVEAWLAENDRMLGLHCGAAVFDGRLVVFPGPTRAGKSTLMARLAADGVRVFTDDLLPLAPDGTGMGFGVPPRLRLPLPERCGAKLRGFVEAHRGPSDEDFSYLCSDAAARVRHGERAPLGAIVLLERHARIDAELIPADRRAGLRMLALQSLGQGVAVGEALARLHALVESLPCFVLRYADLDEVAALLTARFASWPDGDEAFAMKPCAAAPELATTAVIPAATAPSGGSCSGAVFVQTPDIVCRTVDDHVFLGDPSGGAMHELDAIGAALWRLLAAPHAVAQAARMVHAAFPARAHDAIEADVVALFTDLRTHGLIRPGIIAVEAPARAATHATLPATRHRAR